MSKRKGLLRILAVASHTGEDRQGLTAIDRHPREDQRWRGLFLTHLPACCGTEAGPPHRLHSWVWMAEQPSVQLCLSLWSWGRVQWYTCYQDYIPVCPQLIPHVWTMGSPLWWEIFCSRDTRAYTWWGIYVLEMVVVGSNDKSREFRGKRNGLFRTRTFLDSLYQVSGVWTLSLVIVWLHGKACALTHTRPWVWSPATEKTHSHSLNLAFFSS